MSAVKILVTTDGSNLSDKAVDTAIGLAEQVGGSRHDGRAYACSGWWLRG